MTRGVARYLVGSLVVLGLAACGKSWLAERDAWRHEAEVACLKSGQVKEGPSLSRIQPISGPGVCGADFPLKVAAIGEGSPIGYADELRPPGDIRGVRQPLANPPPPSANYQPYPQQAYPQQTYPQQPYQGQQGYPRQAAPQVGAPTSIYAPGVEQPDPYEEDDVDPIEQGAQPYPQNAPQQPPRYGAPPTRPAYPQQSYPQQVPLGRERGPVMTGAVTVQPSATLACPVVSALDQWFASGVQPAALKWFGVQVAEIRQISAYSCRGMNGQRGAPISEHAFGNALDIASFTLADGRKITVKDGWRGLPEEQGFLRDVHASACQRFTTVLAPGSNVYHYDHIHVDLSRRASGRSICNPGAVPGDVIAARAGYRVGQRAEPGVTGSIVSRSESRSEPRTEQASAVAAPAPKKRTSRFFQPFGRDEVYDTLPHAKPGED
jgi:hypothetical protein